MSTVQAKWIPGTADISGALKVRYDVFVTEQGFAEELERDEKDVYSWHILVTLDGEPVATARMFAEAPGIMHAGRICVLKQHRGEGHGDFLMRLLLDRALRLNAAEVHLGAQKRAQGFYEKYGFKPIGDEYFEEDVPHVLMSADAQAMAALFSGCGGNCDKCASCAEGHESPE